MPAILPQDVYELRFDPGVTDPARIVDLLNAIRGAFDEEVSDKR